MEKNIKESPLLGKRIELLSPDNSVELLEERANTLKALYKSLAERIKEYPEGMLYVRKSNGNAQYYLRKSGEVKQNYIPRKKQFLAKELAQKRYFTKCIRLLKKQIELMDAICTEMKGLDLINAFNSIPDLMKPLISPVIRSDEEYVEEWCAQEYGGNDFHEITGGLFTSGGVQVRSKSEVIIGDVLHRMGVPFRYEYPVELERADCGGGSGYGYGLGGSYTAYPDFYCLNVRTRKEFVWEHFGMMDDAEYVEKMVKKLADYQRSGWFYGENMIFTLETARQQLDTRSAEALVKKYLV